MSYEYQELQDKIVAASEVYYLGESPIMSDEDFDKAVDELKSLDKTNPILSQVGFGLRLYGEKTLLPEKIEASLPKIKSQEEINNNLDPDVNVYVLTPKIDGMHVELSYNDEGVLQAAYSRGDGIYGIDITAKIRRISNYNSISFISPYVRDVLYPNGIIHGELYISQETFASDLKDTYENPRNATSGIINGKGFERVGFISFISHDPELFTHGIPSVICKRVNKHWMTTEGLTEFYTEWKEKLGIQIDGVVVDSKWAFKAGTESVEAVVKQVNWNLTDRGKMCPTVQFEEGYRLYGTKVENAHAFNLGYILDNKIGPGAVVEVTKGNEIIPHIVKTILPSPYLIEYPKTFESDYDNIEYKLEVDGIHLVCNDISYLHSMYLTNFIQHYFTTEGVVDAKSIRRALKIDSFNDLEKLYGTPATVYGILIGTPNWGQGRANKISKMFDYGNNKLDINIFLKSFGMRNIGDVLSKRAAKYIKNIGVSSGVSPEEFCDVIKAPSHSREEIIKNWETVRYVYRLFYLFLSEYQENPETREKIVLTGAMSQPRSKIQEELLLKGVEVVGGVSKEVKYVVVATPNSGSSKLKGALQMGIEVISEEKMREIYGI